LKREKEIRWDR